MDWFTVYVLIHGICIGIGAMKIKYEGFPLKKLFDKQDLPSLRKVLISGSCFLGPLGLVGYLAGFALVPKKYKVYLQAK
ncbi:hypothetical protein ACFL16_00355 [Patescibacteria group bacterium]